MHALVESFVFWSASAGLDCWVKNQKFDNSQWLNLALSWIENIYFKHGWNKYFSQFVGQLFIM